MKRGTSEIQPQSRTAADQNDIVRRLRDFPCGAAVKSEAQLEAALDCPAGVVFVLRGDGLEIGSVLRRIHAAGKLAAVHLDLVEGLSSDISGVRWLVRSGADAIISSHSQAVRAIRAEGVTAIQRVLCLSELSVEHGMTAVSRGQPDIVELLPGVILPQVADLVLPRLTVPLLAGGFIRNAEDVDAVLEAGALAVTTTDAVLWNL